ncbi:serine/threonine protein kinase [Shewanella sp. WXL01]|uniref:Serine/threonine protein kinase n=1 Tax=Shewanella maritima TaxID=2520507 RepID=A0A411PHF2_9GAMM|nr:MULTISPECIES: serine/threonine-protein kinase [Shewanella]NKF49045.1 serine/threonine protein kinase [Shewanella sp. WXL01]QBF82812.1 serine/threonine protein kinase [Shewanella maritima]
MSQQSKPLDIAEIYPQIADLPQAQLALKLTELKSQLSSEDWQTLNKMLLIDDTPLEAEKMLSEQMLTESQQTQALKAEAFIGQQVMDFTITELVSETGGMGLVFLGEQRLSSLDEQSSTVHNAAIKVLRTDKLSSAQQQAVFANEASAMMLLDHPNLCRIYGASKVLGQACIVMDFIDGEPLTDWLIRINTQLGSKARHKLKLELFKQLLNAVDYLHSQGMYHGDIKPQNIIVNPQGLLVLIDLGLARKYKAETPKEPEKQADHQKSSLTSVKAFTRNWSAPEQQAGLPTSVASDVYSLGVVLHYLFTQSFKLDIYREPKRFAMESAEQQAEKAQMQKLLPLELSAIIKRAVGELPEQRFASSSEFEQVLSAYLAGEAVDEYSTSPMYRAVKWMKRKPFTTLASILLVYSIAASYMLFVGA